MECYVAVKKKKKRYLHAKPWMNLKNIKLFEKNDVVEDNILSDFFC